MKRVSWLQKHLPARVWDNLVTVSVAGLIAVLVWYGIALHNQSQQNQHRIADNQHRISDIQHSRLVSCEATYRAFLDVFRPLFPAHKTTWTSRQKHLWRKLERTVVSRVQRCGQQTKS